MIRLPLSHNITIVTNIHIHIINRLASH